MAGLDSEVVFRCNLLFGRRRARRCCCDCLFLLLLLLLLFFIEGLFIREFEQGFAVYNRSGSRQNIDFSQEVIGVHSDNRNVSHQVADYDDENDQF